MKMIHPVRHRSADLSWHQAFASVRDASVAIVAPLDAEDCVIQSMPEVSPSKWHLAHTTWFFEAFVLATRADHRFHRDEWRFLFNSYYQSVGPMHSRHARGLLSRPNLAEVLEYRRVVDAAMQELIASDPNPEILARIALGLQHEQQHQELMLTDIKHVLWCNPLQPAYRTDLGRNSLAAPAQRFVDGKSGVLEIGANADHGFAFDCETPRHQTLLHPHQLAKRAVTNGEYLQFIEAGGYRRAELWLSEGWQVVQTQQWRAPLYWNLDAKTEFTLGGTRSLDLDAAVAHVSYYEADAFARWANARLPTEQEWEVAAQAHDPNAGHFVDADHLHPRAAKGSGALLQLFGDVWEWTASPYVNYPGFRPLPGALGEYNGKFMCGQWVLRGGSCVSPVQHLRSSYRNFFYPQDRWQFSGIRLAKDASP